MPTFEELMNDPEVANHPLLAGYKNAGKVREIIEKRSQHLNNDRTEDDSADPTNLTDMFSFGLGGPGEDQEKKMDMREVVHTASSEVHNLLCQFNLPIFPKLSFNKIKDIKYARQNASAVSEGTIVFNVEFTALSGVKKTATIPVTVNAGNIIPPSVMELDGRMYVISQKSINDILGRVTSYENYQLRSQFEPPHNRQEREMAVQERNQLGVKPRDNFYGYMNRPKPRHAAGDQTVSVGFVPKGYDAVIKDMETSEEEGRDTFPRAFNHLLRNYVLNHVSTANKDLWMTHLINDGFCINPYGHGNNRGRNRPRKASENMEKGADFEKEIPFEMSDEPVEVEELESSNLMYPDTKTPIEMGDAVKFIGPSGAMKGTIVEIGQDSLIIKNKGFEYRISVEDIEPLPQTFKKMYQ